MLGHTSASPSRKTGQATMVAYIPAVDIDTDSSWGCISVTTLMICIYLLITDRAENIPVRKISQHFLFWDPVFSFLWLCHLSGNWDWHSQGLASSAGEVILKVSDKIFIISGQELGKQISLLCLGFKTKIIGGQFSGKSHALLFWSWYLTLDRQKWSSCFKRIKAGKMQPPFIFLFEFCFFCQLCIFLASDRVSQL